MPRQIKDWLQVHDEVFRISEVAAVLSFMNKITIILNSGAKHVLAYDHTDRFINDLREIQEIVIGENLNTKMIPEVDDL